MLFLLILHLKCVRAYFVMKMCLHDSYVCICYAMFLDRFMFLYLCGYVSSSRSYVVFDAIKGGEKGETSGICGIMMV